LQARRYSLGGFVLRRLGLGLLVLWFASILIFVGTSIIPGDAATAFLGQNSTPSAVSTLRERLGLNQPLVEQYWHWLSHFVIGDFGLSAAGTIGSNQQQTIAAAISGPAVNSAVLAGIAILFMIPVALALGVFMAIRRGRPSDHVLSAATTVGVSLPEFVTATLLIVVFSTSLGWFPPVALIAPGAGPLSHPQALVLPVATLLVASLGYSVRMIRAGMVEVLGSDYVAAARLGGVSERRVLWRYGLRNALAPSIQVFALTIMYLVGGIVVVETVFGYPGLGSLLVNAVNTHDTPTVQSVALLLATVYVLLNIVADLLVIYLNPKLRTAR
jgi:peptide/nickel transport system permease protein